MSDEKKYCLCGCGTEVKSKWARGHHSRVNNISKRKDIREKRSKSMKKRHEEGIMPDPWNKGKTKENDARLKKQGETWKNNLTDENRLLFSSTMKKQWENENIKPLKGESHPNWKGGTSSIVNRLRGSHQLYINWKKPILKRDNFECQCCHKTSSETRLAVHHYEKRMNEIIKMFLNKDKKELSWEEESGILCAIEDYHETYKVPGITVCYDCHDVIHAREKREGRKLSLDEILA